MKQHTHNVLDRIKKKHTQTDLKYIQSRKWMKSTFFRCLCMFSFGSWLSLVIILKEALHLTNTDNVKPSLYHLRILVGITSVLSLNDYEYVIHAFIISPLDYVNAIYSKLIKMPSLTWSSSRTLWLVFQEAAGNFNIKPLFWGFRWCHHPECSLKSQLLIK